VSKFVEGQTLQNLLEKGRKDYTEGDIARIMKQLYEAECYLKERKIVHRNILPNNVIVDEMKNATLIDFGLSRLTSRGNRIDTIQDISQFTAPESYNGNYTTESDIWSLGNLMYLFFAGKLPFSGENMMGAFKKSTQRKLTFNSSAWTDVSKEAKSMIKQMIVGESQRRISVEDLRNHSWFQVAEDIVNEHDEEVVDDKILQKLKNFQFKHKLQKIFVHMHVNLILDNEEFPEIFKQFNLIDRDQDGMISIKELAETYSDSSVKADEKEVEEIVLRLDFSNKKQLNFTEFLIPLMSRTKLKDKESIKDLFKFFDTDKDDMITQDDILREIQAVDNCISKMELHQLLDQHAKKYKQCLTYEEVENMIMSVK
jgi:calcium-dependent protein kinase